MATNTAGATFTVQMDNGVRLHVNMLGKKDSTKPLLIALHGAPAVFTLAEPEASFGHLSDTFRVLVFDARGSSDSDPTGPYEHDRRWAGAEKFVLTGASYGGFVALGYTVRHNDSLSGLILRDTWANGVLLFVNVAMVVNTYGISARISKIG